MPLHLTMIAGPPANPLTPPILEPPIPMRDYDIRFRLQWLLKDTIEADLLKGRLSMDGKDIALRQTDIDSIADALSDLDGDWSYDEMPNNLDGEWRLVADGALPMDKFGEDLPPELRIIVDILIGYAMENDLTRAFGTLVAIRDLERSNPSEEYIRWFRDMPEGRLDHDTALRLMSEAREDPMIERSQTVAERVMIDLLEQHGCKDIVDAWRFRLRDRILPWHSPRSATSRTMPRNGTGSSRWSAADAPSGIPDFPAWTSP